MPVALLSRLKSLRKLECPPHKDMHVLLKCPELRSVTIKVQTDDVIKEMNVPGVLEDVEGTSKFLSRATQVKQVDFVF